MKKILSLLWVILLVGCYDYREIASLAVVVGMGVDYHQGEYRIVIQTLKKEDQERLPTASATGVSLPDALNNLARQKRDSIFLGHLQIVVISERSGDIKEIVSFLMNNPHCSKNLALAVTADPIEEVINDQDSAVELRQTLAAAHAQGLSLEVALDQFVALEAAVGIEPYLPSLDKDLVFGPIVLFSGYQLKRRLGDQPSLLLALLKSPSSGHLINYYYQGRAEAARVLAGSSEFGLRLDGVLEIDHKLALRVNLDYAHPLERIDQVMGLIEDQVRSLFSDHLVELLEVDVIGYQRQYYLNNYASWLGIADFAPLISGAHIGLEVEVRPAKTGALQGEI